MTVREGDRAPNFELENDHGVHVTLSSLRGRPAIVYFYPRDDTPGCTAQACAIRDSYYRFPGVAVFGISADDRRSHAAFKERYGLPFALLTDVDHAVARRYGAWNDALDAPRRSTFVIDPGGSVAAVLHDVDPTTHADDVLARLIDAKGVSVLPTC